jgi:hypothetical protein
VIRHEADEAFEFSRATLYSRPADRDVIVKLTLEDAIAVANDMRDDDQLAIRALMGSLAPEVFAVSRWQTRGAGVDPLPGRRAGGHLRALAALRLGGDGLARGPAGHHRRIVAKTRPSLPHSRRRTSRTARCTASRRS